MLETDIRSPNCGPNSISSYHATGKRVRGLPIGIDNLIA
jgi:uncharacterized protein YbbK (DUF523 family)